MAKKEKTQKVIVQKQMPPITQEITRIGGVITGIIVVITLFIVAGTMLLAQFRPEILAEHNVFIYSDYPILDRFIEKITIYWRV